MIIPFETLSLFFATALILALAPGPDNIFVLTQSALHGRVAGLFITLGLCTGLVLHTAAIALGITAIFGTSDQAFVALKMVGIGYLFYLAWSYFLARETALDSEALDLSKRKLYMRGVIMNVSNPKVAIFFLAFLPQFTYPAMGYLGLQIMALGAIFILVTFLIFVSGAWFAGYVGKILRQSKNIQIAVNRIAGLIFLGLAVRLFFVER